MSTLLYQLLVEAGERCSELSARAMAGTTAAGEVVEHAQAVGLKAMEEADRLHTEYAEAIASMQQAFEQVVQQAQKAGEAAESVTPEALKAATAVKDMLVGVEDDVIHLSRERVRVFHDLDEEAREAETGFRDLAQQVETFEEHVRARVKQSEEALTRIQTVVTPVTDAIKTAQEDVKLAMESVSSWAVHGFSTTSHALKQVLAALSEGLLKFSNEGIEGHNLTVAAVRIGYLDESKAIPDPDQTHVTASFDRLRASLTGFESMPEPAQSVLDAANTAIVDAGEKAVNGLAEASQSLEQSVGVVTA